jgi:DNA-binding NarL/FixJ family response regulator
MRRAKSTDMRVQTILVAEDESLFRTSVVDSLRARFPGVRLLDVGDGDEALALLRREAVDVLVTDLKMPARSGLELVAHMAEHRLPVQVIVVSAHASSETRASLCDLGALACLDKPIDLATLHATVGRMLQVPRARVSGVTIAGFVQLLQSEQQSCALRVTSEAGAGTLIFERGALVDARMADTQGDMAAMEIFSLPDAGLEVLGTVPVERTTITRPLSFLLLESARFRDEGNEPQPAVPADPSGRWEMFTLGASTMPPPIHEATKDRRSKEQIDMANIQQSLKATMEIEGALGAALVDYQSGMTLGTAGGGPQLDLEIAAAGNTEVMRAKMRVAEALRLDDVIEDVLITLGKQYHLIRPLKKGGSSLFLYLVIDRKRGNLGLARHGLARIESELTV